MPDLNEMIGQVIVAHVPVLHKKIFQQLKLHGVEQGGIWVESQVMTNFVLSKSGLSVSDKTMVFFLPYHQISFVVSTIESSSISEESFGI